MDDLNVVDATQEPNVEVQEVEQVVSVESDPSEVAPEQLEKQVQSKEENSKFAEYRKTSEAKTAKSIQEAVDKEYNNMYGESHNIHSKADFDKVMQKQKEDELLSKYREEESDPETVKQELYKQWEQSDPRLQEYEKIRAESYTTKQLSELNADLLEIGLDSIKSLDDISSLPSAEKVIEHIKNGKTLSEAYFLANKTTIIQKQAQKIQADVIQKTTQLDNASPGALDSTVGNDNAKSIFKMSDSDFAKMKEDALAGRLKR